jgi:hypothetical protein
MVDGELHSAYGLSAKHNARGDDDPDLDVLAIGGEVRANRRSLRALERMGLVERVPCTLTSPRPRLGIDDVGDLDDATGIYVAPSPGISYVRQRGYGRRLKRDQMHPGTHN